MINNLKWAFFGSSEFSVVVLDKLYESGFSPSLIVTVPNKPEGRKMTIKPAEVKVWAKSKNINCLQPQSLKSAESIKAITEHFNSNIDLFLVTHYGKMIPDELLNAPKFKTLNIHPSLLPKLRGPSPIKSAILLENETGVTIIRLDDEMDHGPILSKEKIEVKEWPPYEKDLKISLAKLGAQMFLKILPDWTEGRLLEVEQDHSKATYCTKIQKRDGGLSLEDDPYKNLRKIRAFHEWPTAYFFQTLKNGRKVRVKIKTAEIVDGKLEIGVIVPEGKKEMTYVDYLRGVR